MQKLGEKHRVPTVESALRCLHLRLKSLSALAALADEAAAMRGSVRQAREAWEAASDVSRVATMVVSFADVQLDDSVKVDLKAGLSMMTKSLPPKQREALAGQLFGGKTANEGMKPVGGPAQASYVDAILAHLTTDTFKPLAPEAAKITARRGELIAAEAARTSARSAEQVARTALETAAENARRFYNLMPGRIEAILGDDPAFIESCFIDLRAAAPDQGVEKRALVAVYRARHGAVPREVNAALDDALESRGFDKLVELFATRSAEEIAAAVVPDE